MEPAMYHFLLILYQQALNYDAIYPEFLTSTAASSCDNQKLIPTTLISDEVIKHMPHGKPHDKASGPDGFNGFLKKIAETL
jgi:hypothetical protein